MNQTLMAIEVKRIDQRLDSLKEWRDQLNEKIAKLEKQRQDLLEAMEGEP